MTRKVDHEAAKEDIKAIKAVYGVKRAPLFLVLFFVTSWFKYHLSVDRMRERTSVDAKRAMHSFRVRSLANRSVTCRGA